MEWSDAELAETLRGLDPLPSNDGARTDIDAFVAQVIDRATADPTPPRRLRRRWIVGGVSALALAASGTAAAFLLTSQPDDPTSVACRSIAAPAGGHTIMLEATGDPIAQCAELWRSGQLPDSENTLPPGQAAPPLAACILNGVVQVFPGEPTTLCTDLGLEAASREVSAESTSIIELTDYLVTESEGRCMSMAQAATLADAALDRFDVHDWQVIERTPQRPDDVCVRTIAAVADKTIYLTPLGDE